MVAAAKTRAHTKNSAYFNMEICPSRNQLSRSERQFHGDLDLAHRGAEQQTRDHARASLADRRARGGELRVVEGVEELEAELVFEAFAEAGLFHDTKVELDLARRTQYTASGVAVSP